MKLIIEMKGLGPLTFGKLCNRNAGPLGDYTCDLFIGNLLTNKLILYGSAVLGFLELLLQFRQSAV